MNLLGRLLNPEDLWRVLSSWGMFLTAKIHKVLLFTVSSCKSGSSNFQHGIGT